MNKTWEKIEEKFIDNCDNPLSEQEIFLKGLMKQEFETYFQERLKEVLPGEKMEGFFPNGNPREYGQTEGFNVCRKEILNNVGIKE